MQRKPNFISCCFTVMVVVIASVRASQLRADEESAKKQLLEKEIRVTSAGLMLAEETEFTKGVTGINSLKRKLFLATKDLAAAEAQIDARDDQMTRLMQDNVALNAQLANVGDSDVTLHNRLVGAVNANIGQVNLLMKSQEGAQKDLSDVRKAANTAREAYVGKILELRSLADKVAARYKELADDQKAKSLVAELNTTTGKTFTLEPGKSFQANLKRLEKLESSIMSEKIPLRRIGNSFYASVVIDGEHTHEMIVDTGASLISLPHALAKECGIEVTEADRPITLIIADGTKISGRLKKLDSVRVGKFTVNDVECAVLGPEATEATPLLGMSFLGQFKFELNSQASELSLMQIDEESKSKPTRRTRTSAKKNSGSRKDPPADKVTTPESP